MSARPPPARPHIGVNPSYFSSYSSGTGDWAEDDAWDSGSDSESHPSSFNNAWSTSRPSSSHSVHTSTNLKAVPVPRPNLNASSTGLAFSYTHINAPSPSSYPPRHDQSHILHQDQNQPQNKNGWTIVRKSTDRIQADAGGPDGSSSLGSIHSKHDAGDADVESDMVVPGEFDHDFVDTSSTAVGTSSQFNGRPRQESISLASTVREDVDLVVNDPLRLITRSNVKAGSGGTLGEEVIQEEPISRSASPERVKRERSIRTNRRHRFLNCLTQEDVNIGELRKLAWQGVPNDLRPVVWPLLLGYLPLPSPLRTPTLARKRTEYANLVELAFARERQGLDQQIWHQIEIDVPRTRPGVRLWMGKATQRSLERVLYVWAIRHPASGYVQGINDLVTPFFQVFLSAYIDSDPEEFDPGLLPPHVLNAIEADSFWCLSRLLDGIQDNYISAQPGIQRSVKRMADLVARIDPPLSAHLAEQNVEFMQFAFRWMNCLLMREISVRNTIRMWDTYLAEGADAFSQFHLYVCSAFLVKWSDKLRQMDFQGIIMFLQSLPTQGWTDHDIEMLLSEAFVLSSTWQNAQSHFLGR